MDDNWLTDFIWHYPQTTRYIVAVLVVAYLVYVLDKVV